MRHLLSLGVAAGLSAMACAQYTFHDIHTAGLDQSLINGAGGTEQVGTTYSGAVGLRGALWNGTAASLVDLTPAPAYAAAVYKTDGLSQVGIAFLSGNLHAALWTGTATSWVDLHPAGWAHSYAMAVSGNRQVGIVTNGAARAALWTGTAASFTNLHPAGAGYSTAQGVSATDIVGMVDMQAALWTGNLPTPISLHPAGWAVSVGTDTDGVQQVGYGNTGGSANALLWSGSAASVVNLHPAGAFTSVAQAVRNGKQAGYAFFSDGKPRAIAWSGTAASALDLSQFMGPDYEYSIATGINADGTICGYATHIPSGQQHAVLWKPILPPPYTFVGFLQPMNDPATPESAFRVNQPVILRFKLMNDLGDPVSGETATLTLTYLGATETVINEADSIGNADAGWIFNEISPGSYQYILGTRSLSAGRYRATASIGALSHSVTFSLR